MSENLWEQTLPIAAYPGAVYNLENREFYDVAGAVQAINANPHGFQFAIIRAEQVPPFLVGQVDLDMAEVEAISLEDAQRPVLVGTTSEGHRLLDGYKRARRALMLGAPGLGAWILTLEQTREYQLSNEAAAHVPRIAYKD